jgi:hypothetical protein
LPPLAVFISGVDLSPSRFPESRPFFNLDSRRPCLFLPPVQEAARFPCGWSCIELNQISLWSNRIRPCAWHLSFLVDLFLSMLVTLLLQVSSSVSPALVSSLLGLTRFWQSSLHRRLRAEGVAPAVWFVFPVIHSAHFLAVKFFLQKASFLWGFSCESLQGHAGIILESLDQKT